MATVMTDAERDAIRARLAAATPGPWHVSNDGLKVWLAVCVVGQRRLILPQADSILLAHGKPDAEFIAHAPADMRALLAEVERLRNALRTALDECRNREMPPSFRLAETEKALRAATPDAPPPDPAAAA